jgi:Eco57I restriction-modification methylase/TaqI-like C-terminal specificity domain
MGSAHFLVETVDYITDHFLKFLNQFPINPVNFALDRTRTSILESLGEQGVTVDPNKLTDINLLKRHVLKRCIYGVDLNPMAVELAKVSLWLDAFTLGAPLNFLDHHLRCGNSLLGATFKSLEETTATLFGLNYEPLLRAINHTLFVSKMADATAAEVATSVSRYDQARQSLAGYQIILDLLVAEHFGVPEANQLVAMGSHLDLTDTNRFDASLHDEAERKLVAQVETLARRPDRRFFHWEIEFPEVFFGFIDANERQIKHKDKIENGSAGFDCVVGNPPYVRQEALKVLKPFLSENFECYHAIADLFAYFYDRVCGVVRQAGYIGFITSGSWMKANFGGPLRALLAKRMTLRSVIDFGEWQPFPGAEMIRPSVVVLQRSASKTKARVFRFLTKGNPPVDLTGAVANSPEIDTASLGAEEWRLEGGGLNAIFEKMLAVGVSLGDYTKQKVYRGVTNGLTEAFVLDGETRAKAIRKHRSSNEIIKPYLEGKNLRGWFTEEADLWLIVFPKGVTQRAIGDVSQAKAEKWLETTYPGLDEWLRQFKDAATKRQDIGDYWWELRACEYYASFEKPKIVWPDISKLPRFSMDSGNHFLGNTGYVIPLEDYFLLGVLASWPTWFMISRICQPLRLRAGRWQYRLIRQFMERLPVPTEIQPADRDAIANLARCCNELGPECYRLECDVVKSIKSDLVPVDKKMPQALQHWWEGSFDRFKELVETLQRGRFVGQPAMLWEARLEKEKAARQNIRSRIEAAEAELSERVARAFGLSQAEFKVVMEAVSS